MRRTATALALAALTSLPLTTSWNIGGHSPVKDLTQDNVVNAAKYAMNEGAESLHLPENNGAGWTIGDSACDCEGCACLVSATKQVVAGMNWVLVLKLIPVGKDNVEYRRVTVYDQSFAGGEDKYKISKTEVLKESEATASSFTQSALDSIGDPNAQSDHHSQESSSSSSTDGDAAAKKYMDKLTSKTAGLVQHVVYTPQGCDKAQKVEAGDVVSMHYTGTLPNGKKFDSSYDRGQPFEFTVGDNQVIKGWEQSIPGMCVGEKSKLYIPSNLAYGEAGFGAIIPPKSNLIFDVEVMGIKRG